MELTACPADVAAAFADRHSLHGRQVIGISARIATEKGIEVLLRALPQIAVVFPDVLVLHANPQALGESDYAKYLQPLINQNQHHYQQLGNLQGCPTHVAKDAFGHTEHSLFAPYGKIVDNIINLERQKLEHFSEVEEGWV